MADGFYVSMNASQKSKVQLQGKWKKINKQTNKTPLKIPLAWPQDIDIFPTQHRVLSVTTSLIKYNKTITEPITLHGNALDRPPRNLNPS